MCGVAARRAASGRRCLPSLCGYRGLVGTAEACLEPDKIDTPRDGATRRAGTVVVAGIAWAQHRGVRAVEVRVDGGPWAPAKLYDTVSADTWRQWSYAWSATPGQHTVRVRAIDNAGATQTSTPAPPEPDGATGWHAIQVTID